MGPCSRGRASVGGVFGQVLTEAVLPQRWAPSLSMTSRRITEDNKPAIVSRANESRRSRSAGKIKELDLDFINNPHSAGEKEHVALWMGKSGC